VLAAGPKSGGRVVEAMAGVRERATQLVTKVMLVPSHRMPPRERARRRGMVLTSGLAALAAVLVGGYLVGHGAESGTAATGSGPRSCSSAGPATSTCGRPSPRPRAGTDGPSARRHSGTPDRKPRRRHRLAPGHSPAAPTPAATPGSADARAAASVLATINQARAQAGLPAYTVSSGLVTSAGRHNHLMADGCGLSHQCPGEPPLGDRETAAGVHWTAAGENIGEGGPVADTTAAITQLAVALTQDMLNEKPPDDGHRLNLLSSTFTHIGIVIYRDSNGTVWMTQDLSN